MAEQLGENYEIIEEGLNSRTLISDDKRPGREGRNGYEYLIPCLDTHDPVDLVVLMLGTNELKNVYDKTAEEIGEDFEKYFVKTILGRKSQIGGSYPKLLIISPAIVNEDADYCRKDNKYLGASKKSEKLNTIYEQLLFFKQ